MPSSQRQINIRLPEDEADVLEAAAFLERDALADYVRAVLRERINGLRQEPRVRELLRLRAEQDAVAEGTVSRIDNKRRNRNGGDA